MTETDIHKTISATVDQEGVTLVAPEKLSETEVESSEIPTRGGTDEKSSPVDSESESTAEEEFCKRNFGFLPIPKNCRVSPTKPFKFNLAINLLFGFASTFTVDSTLLTGLMEGCQSVL
jgi:hypothetical protein